MEVFQTIINYVLNLGSAIFVPLIILILGLLAGMKLKKSIHVCFDFRDCF